MDYPYILNYFILLVLAYLYWKKPDPRLVKWAFVLEFIFIALRAPVVGADTWNYVRYLDGERNFYIFKTEDDLDPAFMIYRNIVSSWHAPRVLYMVLNTLLSCIPVYILIKRYSFNPILSLFLLPVLNIYYLYFCGLRQIIGFGLLILGLMFVLEKRKKAVPIAITLAVLGFFFHKTIIIYVLVFLLAYLMQIKNRSIPIILVVISATVGIVLQAFNILDFFNFFINYNLLLEDRYEMYIMDDSKTVSSSLLSFLPSILVIISFCAMEKRKLNHIFTKIYLLGVVIGNLFVSMPQINRLCVAFYIFGLVVFSWIWNEHLKCNIQLQKYVNITLLLLLLWFTQAYIRNNIYSNIDLQAADRMHPYQFFWEDYRNHPSIKYFN